MKDPAVFPIVINPGDTEGDVLSAKRRIEWLAMHYMASAVRCQGKLTPDRRDFLIRVCRFLNVSQERYQAEIRRVLCDESLTKIAELIDGPNVNNEWLQEGRNLIPTFYRTPPDTIYKAYADEIARLFNESSEEECEVDGDISDDDSVIAPLRTGALEILCPAASGSEKNFEETMQDLKSIWGATKEENKNEQLCYDSDSSTSSSSSSSSASSSSSGQESLSSESESELSAASISGTSADEKPNIKTEERENVSIKGEKTDDHDIIEVISEEETISVKSDQDDVSMDIKPSVPILNSEENICKDNENDNDEEKQKNNEDDNSKDKDMEKEIDESKEKEDEDCSRKRRASTCFEELQNSIPLKVQASTVQSSNKVQSVAVTTNTAVNVQPTFKYSACNTISTSTRTPVTVTSASQKVIIVSSSGSVSNSSILQRSLSTSSVKTSAANSVTPVLSTTCHVQPVSSNAISVKHKPKTVTIPAKCRDPIVIRSQNIQLKSPTSVTLGSQDISLKRVPMPGITNAAKILTKPAGGTGTSSGSAGGHVLVMSTSATSTVSRNTVSGVKNKFIVVGQRLSVPVRSHLPSKQDGTTSFQTTKIIQGTTANSKPVIVLQKGGTQVHAQRGVTLTTATKELVNKVLMGKNVSTLSRPLVSVQKAATVLKPGSNIPFSASQGNVIVLDLSQEHISKNATLAEILHASGIISENTTITTATSTITSAGVSGLNKVNTPVTSISASSVTVGTVTVTAPATTNVVTVPSSFNTNTIITASTNTITSVQASSENKEVEIKDWSGSNCVSTESENIDFDLSFTLEESTAEPEDINDDQSSHQEEKLDDESVDKNISESEDEDETSEGNFNTIDKVTTEPLHYDDSSEKEKSEKSDPVLVQSTSDCNIEIFSSSDNDATLDSFQMMQVESIAELPTESVAFITEESQSSSDNRISEEQLQERTDLMNTEDDNAISFLRHESTENTTLSVTTEDESDNVSVAGME